MNNITNNTTTNNTTNNTTTNNTTNDPAAIAAGVNAALQANLQSTEESPAHDAVTAKAAMLTAIDNMKNAPILVAGSELFGAIPQGGTCASFSINVFGKDIGTSLHCDIYDTVKPVLSAAFYAVWAIFAFFVFRGIKS